MTSSRRGCIIFAVNSFPKLSRAFLALAAATVFIASAPIHAAHGHDESSPSATMHASCAVCHMHAPAGTPSCAAVAIVEPGLSGRLVADETLPTLPAPLVDTHACRAPPVLLAL